MNLEPIATSSRSETYVRRNLFELPDVVSGYPPSTERSEFAPNHEAIVLTGSHTEDGNRTRRPNLPAVALERLRQFEIELSQVLEGEGERPSRPARPSLNTLSNSEQPSWVVLNSPVSPLRQNLPRRSLLESQVIRRRELSEDSSTFHGRHVAAREAAASSNSTELPRRFERDLEIFRSLTRQRRSEPVNSSENTPRTEIDRNTRSLDVNVLRGTQLTTSPTAIRGLVNFNNFRNRRPLRTDSRQPSTPSSGSQMADRLSLLSNLSVQNLSTPTSVASRERPLLFEEPSSYVNSPIEEDESRSYSVRRRINAQGDEVVHNITLDLEEDPTTWSLPVRERAQINSTVRTTRRLARPNYQRDAVPAVIPSSDRVRRNWAVLDPDGDILPWDEDEELDGARRGNQAPSLLVPLSRSSFFLDEDIDESPRVRINSRDIDDYAVADAAIDHIIECQCRNRLVIEPFGSDVPLCVDPLPMPLEKMIPSRKVPSSEGIPVDSKFAVLAGR